MSKTMEPSTTTMDGKTITVSTIPELDYGKIVHKDPATIKELMDTATYSGWFYADLRNSAEGKKILADVDPVYKSADDYFCGESKSSKESDARSDQESWQDRGYKTSSCDETFEMALDEMHDGSLPLPKALNKDRDTILRFSEHCQEACKNILACLSEGLGQQLEQYHRPGQASDSGLKLIYEPSLPRKADVGDNLHTDSGSMTFLFYDKWGLHSNTPPYGFTFTAPKDGMALINIGDSLQRLSGNKLVSPKHRVSQPVDGAEKRYYLSYFLRPEAALQQTWREEAAAAS